jgi:crotonobetainyl-CoA:carnitine CoA-transferase CaiB-like acyl-CoA transferase
MHQGILNMKREADRDEIDAQLKSIFLSEDREEAIKRFND